MFSESMKSDKIKTVTAGLCAVRYTIDDKIATVIMGSI